MRQALAVTGTLFVVFGALSTGAQETRSRIGKLTVEMPELCTACHPEVEAWLDHPGGHAPASTGACLECHSVHAARHEGLLPREGARLCLTCHEDVRASLAGGGLHEPLRAGGCLDCHDPHASDHSPLLVADMREMCLTCHRGLAVVAESTHTHAPFTAGECSDCHNAHASGEWPLLHMAEGELCTGCHDTSDAGRHHLGIELKENCTSCHDPHGSESAGLLQEVQHAPFEMRGCDGCHDTTASDPRTLTAPASDLCVVCHSDYAADAGKHGVHPGSIGGADGDCTSCHSPHAGSTAALLRHGTRQTCTECHSDVAELFETERHAHALDLEGQGCTGCHDPHDGSERGLLVAGGGVDACNSCHEGHAFFSHPMGEGVPDPSREGELVDCVSCHTPHGSRWSGFLRAEGNRELCLLCHEDPTTAGPKDAARGGL